MVYFKKLCVILTLDSISKGLNCFNENTHNVQNFYFNNWDNDINQTDIDHSVIRVGVRIQQVF